MYSAKILEKVEVPNRCICVGIFDGDNQIGEYVRNIQSATIGTFCPFKIKEKWYAIFSKNYTVDSVMSLPDCKILDCSLTTPGPWNECSLEYYIPKYKLDSDGSGEKFYDWDEDGFFNSEDQKDSEIFYEPSLCFVKFCEWATAGDDLLKIFDLSRIEEGIMTVRNDFKPSYLPSDIPLQKCVRIYGNTFSVAINSYFTIKNKKIELYE